jgi:hypothetical protein
MFDLVGLTGCFYFCFVQVATNLRALRELKYHRKRLLILIIFVLNQM